MVSLPQIAATGASPLLTGILATPPQSGLSGLTIDDIVAEVHSYAPDADQELMRKAYCYGAMMHRRQRRKSGEPYFHHPIEVGMLLAKQKMDVDTIAAALLHDVVEDTPATTEEIRALFNGPIAEVVEGVTKLSKIDFSSREEHQAESFRKLIFAMANDVRVILVKLADRTHNMSTLGAMKPAKQRRIASETLEIYAPIAGRLGMSRVKGELQDLCFRYLHPKPFERLSDTFLRNRSRHERYIEKVRRKLLKSLAVAVPGLEVYGRVKAGFSIWKKLQSKDLQLEDLDKLHDLLAFRVVVDDVAQCYTALGLVHALWAPNFDRFKDYIARPKANGYKSLHTTVLGPNGQRFEVQIRTRDMHQFAEFGIAAHWRYKEGHLDLSQRELERYTRLRQLAHWAESVEDSREFLDLVKLDLYDEEVYVYTPRGEVRWFPLGATALDFAFAIHTEVGLRASAIKIDGRIVALDYKLQPGDQIEVITSARQTPSKDWLRKVHTSRAKGRLRQYLRRAEREHARELGRSELEIKLEALKLNLSKMEKDRNSGLIRALDELSFRRPEDLYLALGFGSQDMDKALDAIAPEERRLERQAAAGIFTGWLQRMRKPKPPPRRQGPVVVDGYSDLVTTLAQCCSPLPPDPIMGLITRSRGVSIHRGSCANLLAAPMERRVRASWASAAAEPFEVHLRLVTLDKPGVLAKLSKVIGRADVNIRSATATTADRRGVILFTLGVNDHEQLVALIRDMEGDRDVVSVTRVTDGEAAQLRNS